MSQIIHPRRLQAALIERGLIPANCRLVEVSIGPREVPVVRYEVLMDGDRLALFAEAFKAAADRALMSQPGWGVGSTAPSVRGETAEPAAAGDMPEQAGAPHPIVARVARLEAALRSSLDVAESREDWDQVDMIREALS